MICVENMCAAGPSPIAFYVDRGMTSNPDTPHRRRRPRHALWFVVAATLCIAATTAVAQGPKPVLRAAMPAKDARERETLDGVVAASLAGALSEQLGNRPVKIKLKHVDVQVTSLRDRLVSGQGEGAGWRLPKSAMDSIAACAGGKRAEDQFSVKNAVLWGGNLAVLSSLVGTPYLPVVKGGILFLEEVHEHPYRLERMLTQLLHAGVLARQKAVILGQFTNYKLVPHDQGFKLATVVAWLQKQIKAPILTGLPFGHVPTKVVLPVGAKVTLVVEGRDAFLLWGHTHN